MMMTVTMMNFSPLSSSLMVLLLLFVSHLVCPAFSVRFIAGSEKEAIASTAPGSPHQERQNEAGDDDWEPTTPRDDDTHEDDDDSEYRSDDDEIWEPQTPPAHYHEGGEEEDELGDEDDDVARGDVQGEEVTTRAPGPGLNQSFTSSSGWSNWESDQDGNDDNWLDHFVESPEETGENQGDQAGAHELVQPQTVEVEFDPNDFGGVMATKCYYGYADLEDVDPQPVKADIIIKDFAAPGPTGIFKFQFPEKGGPFFFYVSDHLKGSPLLPDGWEAFADENGDIYYWDAATGLSQWEVPDGARHGEDCMGPPVPSAMFCVGENCQEGWFEVGRAGKYQLVKASGGGVELVRVLVED